METLRNESLEKSINNYFDGFSCGEVKTDTELGIIVNGLVNMNRSEEAEGKKGSYQELIKKLLGEVIAEDGSVISKNNADNDADKFCIGNSLVYAYQLTGDDTYKNAVYALAKKLDNVTKFSINDAFDELVFYMNYETVFGGKERYNKVITEFKEVSKYLKSDITNLELGMFMCAAIDAMEIMEQPVFEVYKSLEEMYIKAVKKAEKLYDPERDMYGDDEEASMLITYAILKGCRMKALITQKHENKAISALLKAELAHIGGMNTMSNFFLGAFINAYAESTKNREYQDYGRANGGKLWN